MYSIGLKSLAWAAAFAVALTSAAHAQDESLRIGGTGVALGGMQLLGEAFAKSHPESRIEVLPSLGSSGGIKALLAGAVDLAVTARAPKDEELAAGAEGRLYARTPLAFVTRSDSTVQSVTTADLTAIYAGTMTHWPDGTPIRVVMRPATETDTELLRGLSPSMDKAVEVAFAREGLVTAATDQENAETLESLEGSLGLAAMGQIATERRSLKMLSLDGVQPEPKSASKAGNAFVKDLYIVTTLQTSPIAAAFIEFIASPEGQNILAETDHSPVN